MESLLVSDLYKYKVIVVELLSCLWLCDPMHYSMPGFPVHHNSQKLLKLMSIQYMMPSNPLILCRSLLLPPSVFPSIRVFSNEMVLYSRWPKYWLAMATVFYGILQARILKWIAFPFFRGSLQPRNWTQVSHIAGGFFTNWTTREAQEYWSG